MAREFEQVSVDFLDCNPKHLQKLKLAGYKTVASVLQASEQDLCKRCSFSVEELAQIISVSSQHVLQEKTNPTSWRLFQNPCQTHLTVGCPLLDAWLRGGLRVPSVTELAGVSSAGKTQFCLQLALTVQLPFSRGGLEGATVYISTEDVFPHRRLKPLAESFCKNHSDLSLTPKQCMDQIYVDHCLTTGSLDVMIQHHLPKLMSSQSIRLIIVDSLAAILRAEFSNSQLYTRARFLSSFGAKMRMLASRHNAVVLVVNQVTGSHHESHNGVSVFRPALGETWSNQINVRLIADRTSQTECGSGQAGVLRTFTVSLAPHLPETSHHYYIDGDGVHGIDFAGFID